MAKLANELDMENLVDRLLEDINQQQDELRQYYSCNAVMVSILEGRLKSWRRRNIRLLAKTFSPVELKPLNTVLKNNFQTLIASMEAAPSTRHIPPDHSREKARQKDHRPRASNVPPLYIEQQEYQQCGRHSVNAYHQYPVLRLRSKYDDMDVQDIFEEMVDIEKRKKNPHPLVLFRYLLTSATGDSPQTAREQPTPTCFDDMPVKRMILTLPNHHVCFWKSKEGEWYLLDSVRGQPKKMKPSTYIARYRKSYSRQQILQHRNAVDRPLVAVICEDKGQDLTNLGVLNNRAEQTRN